MTPRQPPRASDTFAWALIAVLLIALALLGADVWSHSRQPAWSLPQHGNALECQTNQLVAYTAHKHGEYLSFTPGPCAP